MRIPPTLKERYRAEPYASMLYLGGNPAHCMELEERARRSPFQRFFQAFTASEVAELISTDRLHIGDWDGCLLVAWDPEDGPNDLARALSLLPRPSWSLGVMGVVLRNATAITRQDFLKLVRHDFFTVESWADFQRRLEGLENNWQLGPADLCIEFPRRPSGWLRGLRHDYFQNVVVLRRDELESAGQWEAQKELDFFQVSLRNLFQLSGEPRTSRCLPLSGPNDMPIHERRALECGIRFIVPNGLAEPFHQIQGRYDCATYTGPGEALIRIREAAQAGYGVVVVGSPEFVEQGSQRQDTRCAWVEVADDRPRRTWGDWQKSHARNLVASYTMADLLVRDGDDSELEQRFPEWRLAALMPIPEIFDRLAKTLTQTLAFFEERGAGAKPAEQIFGCLAAVEAARNLYLGPLMTGSQLVNPTR